MKKTFMLAVFCLGCIWGASGQSIFFNEIHYDNFSTDTLEGFEIAGPAGTQLECFKVRQYAADSTQNSTEIFLYGRIPDQCSGYGCLWFDAAGQMSNSGPRGLVLMYDASNPCCQGSDPDSVYHFVSYEGTILALDGVAVGKTSTPTTFGEGSSVPVGNSLQLQGTGTQYSAFTGWGNPTTTAATMGAPNVGQVFGAGPGCDPNSVTADRLTFSTALTGCIVPGETFELTVCASDSTGDVALSFNSNITLSVGSGPGVLGGTLTQLAINGCATFPGLSLSAAGDYLLDANGGSFAGSSPAYISANCDTCPWLSGVHVDACGTPEGNNEILFYNTGDYAVPVNGNSININYGMTTPLQTGYTRTLVSNQNYVDSLNARAGCNLFVDAVDTGLVPPNSELLIMYHDPTYVYDFTAWCALGIAPVYIAFSCDEDWDTLGNFKNAITCGGNGSQPRYFESDFTNVINGDTCVFTNTYTPCVDLMLQMDGDGLNFGYWDSTYIARWNACDPFAILPVEFGEDLTANPLDENVQLTWSTLQEINSAYFEIERSSSPEGGFEAIGQQTALGSSQGKRRYRFLDTRPLSEIAWYRVKSVDGNGMEQYSRVVAVSPDGAVADVNLFSPRQGSLDLEIAGTGPISLRFWSLTGQLLHTQQIQDDEAGRTVSLNISDWPTGVYLYQVEIGGKPFRGKVVVGD